MALIVCGIFGLLAGVCIYESHIESIVFDKPTNSILLKRTTVVSWSTKITHHRLSDVVRVYAALRGCKKGNNDMTSYHLIMKLASGQTLKILETRNASKIRREVSLFLLEVVVQIY